MSKKLELLKGVLRVWNKKVFSNVHLIVKSALDNVESIQQCLNDLCTNQDLIEQEQQAQKELMIALNLEEELWREKIAKITYATKSLTMLRDGEDVLTNQSTIANLALGYFTDLYASQSQDQSNNLIQSFIHLLVSDLDNSNLTKLPLLEEIKCDVFSLNVEGAPGPDRFGDCFFLEFWDIVGLDGKISSIDGPRSSKTPTHVLYAGDIIIFCKRIKREILALKNLFGRYSQASVQMREGDLGLRDPQLLFHQACMQHI
ncbi:hypothetical protein Lal_00012692 [Lupinus albus]|nr:hypothetical protein Lal_00012692 [Lupinus albus]